MLNKEICKHCNKKNRSERWEPWDDAVFEHHWKNKVVLCPLGAFKYLWSRNHEPRQVR